MSTDWLYCDAPGHGKRKVRAAICGTKRSRDGGRIFAHSHLCRTHAKIEAHYGATVVDLHDCPEPRRG